MRDQFMLDPSVVFLNHGSFGACPRVVFDEYQRWQRELEAQPVEFLGRRFYGLMNEARASVATYLNVPANDLVFVPNATSGVNVVAQSVKLEAGDEILTSNLEYGACTRAWQFYCDQAGARIVEAPVTVPVVTAAQVVEEIWSGVTPRTKVLYLSHITSGTALILPIAELCARARAAGIMTVIDGAHATGQLELDLTAIGADAYTGNCHKWLCAPKGSGFLYVRPEFQSIMGSGIVSWGWVPGHGSHMADETLQFVSRNQWQGTKDYAAYLTIPTAIAFQAEHDWPAVRARCHDLVLDAQERILALSGLPPISPLLPPDGYQWFVQLRAIPIPPVDLPQLKQRLYDDYRIEVPMAGMPLQPMVRVSAQAYTTQADIDALVNALAELLPQLAV